MSNTHFKTLESWIQENREVFTDEFIALRVRVCKDGVSNTIVENPKVELDDALILFGNLELIGIEPTTYEPHLSLLRMIVQKKLV